MLNGQHDVFTAQQKPQLTLFVIPKNLYVSFYSCECSLWISRYTTIRTAQTVDLLGPSGLRESKLKPF